MSQHLKMSHELKKKHVPINLARKAQRERRIRNGGIGRNRKRNRMKRLRKKKKQNFELSELETLVSATENHLKEILANDEQLSDIPYDVTPEELQGELPQENPTIAQLKRAIEAQARVQQKRELRERYEERIRRRGLSGTAETIVEEHKHKQVNKSTKNNLGKPQYATGELVCSATHNGHQHRPNVSWRFLWRAYILFNIATQTFVEDKNGRKLLKECGIENAQTLKFYKRDKYFGKKRQ
ncbi:uncharacterized protein LOC111676658 isoform X2 [Lucilia cuprina]|uniref:uncharacterized protein LOC111676658 isoform X2 n=1 Tax=Lucilia cuprina TaxID=7375 RepID=UPI001F0591E4|nr:uncharacterized protein LOC111676658 isoform X2 [Lucilia cuprina]